MSKKKNVHAVALGRRGGKVGGLVKSHAKTAAARENGKRGGRPKKSRGYQIPVGATVTHRLKSLKDAL